jgi:uncharacterized protein YdhG (YjbR/CyaY superfamily)
VSLHIAFHSAKIKPSPFCLSPCEFALYAEPMTIAAYIAVAPEQAKPILLRLQGMVRNKYPDAEETISYKLPAFKQGRVFIYFAAFKQHIGIYPPVPDPAALVQALAPYRGPKGNLQFQYKSEMPYALIAEVIDALHKAYALKT